MITSSDVSPIVSILRGTYTLLSPTPSRQDDLHRGVLIGTVLMIISGSLSALTLNPINVAIGGFDCH